MLKNLIGCVYPTRKEAIEAVGEELSNQGIEVRTYDYRTSIIFADKIYLVYFYKWQEGYEVKSLDTTEGKTLFINKQTKIIK